MLFLEGPKPTYFSPLQGTVGALPCRYLFIELTPPQHLPWVRVLH